VLREILILRNEWRRDPSAVAWAGDRLVSNLLFGLKPSDPVTLMKRDGCVG